MIIFWCKFAKMYKKLKEYHNSVIAIIFKIQASMNEDKDLKIEVRRGQEKKVKPPFLRDVRLRFLACLYIYPDLAPA